MSRFARLGHEDAMSTLCRMVVNTNYADLPTKVVDYAKLSILDTIAVTIGGSAMEGVTTIVDFVKKRGGEPQSIIPFYGGKVPASEAAFAIGPMTRAMDFGDVHEEAMHCSEYTIPPLLAATGLKEKVTGKEFIAAFVVGQEVLIRIGLAFKRTSRGGAAGRGSSHSIFGATASVGKLLGLSFDELENAEGIARCMTQPHDTAMFTPATLMVRVHHGFVGQDAINACLLAQRGITGPRGGNSEVLLGQKGYLEFAKWKTEPEELWQGLGEEWRTVDVTMKPYASCKCTHTSISGLLDLMDKHAFTAEDIESLDMDESPINWSIASSPREVKWNPVSIADCQFSLPYNVSVAAYEKDVFIDAYDPEMRVRRDIRQLMTRMTAREDTSLPPFAARLHVMLRDGKQYIKECIYVKGHPKNPMTRQDLTEKLRKCSRHSAYKLDSRAIDSIAEAILSLEKTDDVVKSLLLPLVPG